MYEEFHTMHFLVDFSKRPGIEIGRTTALVRVTDIGKPVNLGCILK
jgi:hypothetical protein